MKYRKYNLVLSLFILGLAACASHEVKNPDAADAFDGNEPVADQSHTDYGWLDNVENEFSRIAAASSKREIASTKSETLFRRKKARFTYQKAQNQFVLTVDGQSFPMTQANLSGEGFQSFVGSGVENPPSLTIDRVDVGRGLASASQCRISLNYFNVGKKTYTDQSFNLNAKECAALSERLKDYVP